MKKNLAHGKYNVDVQPTKKEKVNKLNSINFDKKADISM